MEKLNQAQMWYKPGKAVSSVIDHTLRRNCRHISHSSQINLQPLICCLTIGSAPRTNTFIVMIISHVQSSITCASCPRTTLIKMKKVRRHIHWVKLYSTEKVLKLKRVVKAFARSTTFGDNSHQNLPQFLFAINKCICAMKDQRY